MKFCAVICEYNPFHNGHKYQLEQIRLLSGCDGVLCLMSGNFTQRGEAALWNKFTRARHAVENGADIVIELPTAFAVASAEIFALGAVRLLSSIPLVTTLAFGCESGTREEFLSAAARMNVEDRQFKTLLKERMKDGTSYVKARTETVLKCNPDLNQALLTSPNNILGTEYCRALLACGSKISPLPLPRKGGGYSDLELKDNFSSASALRSAIFAENKKSDKLLKSNLPEDVFRDLREVKKMPYETAAVCALIRNEDDIAKVPDCSEGLENRLKAMAFGNPDYNSLLEKVVTKRYTLSRLKRILAQNFLGIRRKDVEDFLSAPLYLKVLAAREDVSKELFSAIGESKFPLIARKSDSLKLKGTALCCFETDVRATLLYNTLNNTQINPFETLFL